MAGVLLRLADLTDDTELGAHGEALLRCRLGQAAAQPTAFA